MRAFGLACLSAIYRHFIKPILFRFDPERVHEKTVALGEHIGADPAARTVIMAVHGRPDLILRQELFGLTFRSPVGLAAGFDYEGRLTHILPALGFGFGTTGTLTRHAYAGNPYPRLGRLPRSRSLIVNKGFKNLGVATTLAQLAGHSFAYPVGVSIGRTNTRDHATHEDAVSDIVAAFQAAESSRVPFAYYELNISCPNLAYAIEFDTPELFDQLLGALAALNLTRPIFIKMPISKTNGEITAMMDVLVQYPFIAAVIFGNLQHDRAHPALIAEEVARFTVGSFSGAPCRERADELIALTFQRYGQRVRIIGCGGIFTAEDAYRKIRLGASLVQLITGLVFEGPQLVAQINHRLAQLLKRDGYHSLSAAIGTQRYSSEIRM